MGQIFNRRRYARKESGSPSMIYNGLQLWFDGKNNLSGGGFSSSATTWYPYVKNASIPNSYCLTKYGNITWKATGGLTQAGGVYSNRGTTPLYYIPNVGDFTYMVCADATFSSMENKNYYLIGSTYVSGSAYNNRYGFSVGNGYLKFSIVVNGSWTHYISSNSILGIHLKTIAWVRSGSTLKMYVNGSLFYSTTCTTTILGRASNIAFALAAFSNDSNNADLPFYPCDYYGCSLHNRALSENEIAAMDEYLTNRYEI